MTCTCTFCTPGKPIDGAPKPVNVPADMHATPPVPCEFKVGDRVTYTNPQGVKFDGPFTIRGFSETVSLDGRFVYYDSDSWWFPVNPKGFQKVTL